MVSHRHSFAQDSFAAFQPAARALLPFPHNDPPSSGSPTHPIRAATRFPLEPGVPLAKPTTRFVCQSCGAVTPKWAGRCETCGEWNPVEPEAIPPSPGAAARKPPAAASSVNFVGLRGDVAPPPRAITGIEELDRV